MRLPITIAIALALPLAACGEIPDQAPLAEETMMPVEPDGGISDGATPLPEPAPGDDAQPTNGAAEEPDVPEEAKKVASANAIPSDYHGVWDYVDGTCAPESDLRLEIAADTITFYESIGEVTGVERLPNGDKIVTLAMSGEGETWETRLRLTMDSTAMRLVAQDADAAAEDPTSRRKRCT